MKLKYYLRGLGLGMVVAALVMGFSKSGPSSTDAGTVTEQSAGNEGKTLAEVADANLKDKEAGTDGENEASPEAQPKDGESSGGENTESNNNEADMPKTEGDESPALEGGGDDSSAPGQEDLVPSQSGSKETGTADDNGNDSEKAVLNEEKQKSGTPGDEVGAGLPLSERIDAFSGGGDDAPGTRAARGETTTAGSNKNGNNSNKNSNAPGNTGSKTSSNPTNAANQGNMKDTVNTANSGTGPLGAPSEGKTGNGDNVSISATYTISVYPGEGSYTVSRKLASQGLVESAEVFDTFLCQNGYDKKIRTGNYEIMMGQTPEQIARIITTKG